jgi:hypothetical protein
MTDPKSCLVCGADAADWGICGPCEDAYRLHQQIDKNRKAMGLTGGCYRCGSKFPDHRCSMVTS